MGKALYENKEELLQAIEKYLRLESKPTPRHFRAIGLGVTKSLLAHWKKEKPEYFNLIKNAEDLILAVMEQKFSYGGKEYYNLFATLKAYDKETWLPELRNENELNLKQVLIKLPRTQAEKGKQSDRKLKRIPKK